jgi:hypothetical protein
MAVDTQVALIFGKERWKRDWTEFDVGSPEHHCLPPVAFIRSVSAYLENILGLDYC